MREGGNEKREEGDGNSIVNKQKTTNCKICLCNSADEDKQQIAQPR